MPGVEAQELAHANQQHCYPTTRPFDRSSEVLSRLK